MSATDITLRDFHAREYPYRSYKTVQRWARQGLIHGAKLDVAGNWVVDLSVNKGLSISGVVNDVGVSDEVFDRLLVAGM